jgi:hypothetical protein
MSFTEKPKASKSKEQKLLWISLRMKSKFRIRFLTRRAWLSSKKCPKSVHIEEWQEEDIGIYGGTRGCTPLPQAW